MDCSLSSARVFRFLSWYLLDVGCGVGQPLIVYVLYYVTVRIDCRKGTFWLESFALRTRTLWATSSRGPRFHSMYRLRAQAFSNPTGATKVRTDHVRTAGLSICLDPLSECERMGSSRLATLSCVNCQAPLEHSIPRRLHPTAAQNLPEVNVQREAAADTPALADPWHMDTLGSGHQPSSYHTRRCSAGLAIRRERAIFKGPRSGDADLTQSNRARASSRPAQSVHNCGKPQERRAARKGGTWHVLRRTVRVTMFDASLCMCCVLICTTY